MRGAGGSSGGIGRFLIGLAMMIGGTYLFLDSIRIGFNWHHSIYRWGGFNFTGGMVLIPFMFGIGFIFYNKKNVLGWILAGGSLLAFIFGVVRSLRFNLAGISAFDLIVTLVLMFGGLGLFVSSLKDFERRTR